MVMNFGFNCINFDEKLRLMWNGGVYAVAKMRQTNSTELHTRARLNVIYFDEIA